MKFSSLIAVAVLAVSSTAFAQGQTQSRSVPTTAASGTPTTEGEVRKVDKEQGKLTLRHGPIANLDMPGMTMVFKVADPKMLDAVKQGDKVKFGAQNVNGALTVTTIAVTK